MNEELITGIVYTEFDQDFQPNPTLCIPSSLSESTKNLINNKIANLILDSEGVIPDSIVIIPFPSKKLKGLIKCIQIRDNDNSEIISLTAITLVFNEIDDLIFYKYMKDLVKPFNDLTHHITKLQKNNDNTRKIEILKEFQVKILNILEEFRQEEYSSLVSEIIPEKLDVKIKDVEYRFKIVVVGDRGVGKTSLVLRFTDKAFIRKYLPTLGVNLSRKNILLQDCIVQLIIWDIAGQQKFDELRRHFYTGTDASIFVYDITRPDTYKSIKEWFSGLMGCIPSEKKTFGYLIGNKNDLKDEGRITFDEGRNLADQLNLQFIETSALTGENVDEAFYKIAEKLIKIKSK